MDISGKVVLITGASMGIGRAAALRFAQAGARLALTARSVALLQEVAAEIRAAGGEVFTLSADLYAPDEARRVVTETLHHFGRLDILINNAGQAAAGDVERVSLEHFDRIMHLNVYAPLAAMQTAIPAMRAQGGGLVINVSSMVSKMHIPGLSAYAATKVALNMLTDTARGELAEEGIKVITVYPRLTSTGFGEHSLGNREERRRQREGTPQPVDTPEHVADRIYQAAVDEVDEMFMA